MVTAVQAATMHESIKVWAVCGGSPFIPFHLEAAGMGLFL